MVSGSTWDRKAKATDRYKTVKKQIHPKAQRLALIYWRALSSDLFASKCLTLLPGVCHDVFPHAGAPGNYGSHPWSSSRDCFCVWFTPSNDILRYFSLPVSHKGFLPPRKFVIYFSTAIIIFKTRRFSQNQITELLQNPLLFFLMGPGFG